MIDKLMEQTVLEFSHRIWTGTVSNGAPVSRVRGFRQLVAVRRMILLERGPVQPGVFAVATCGNPLCVDPKHVRGVSRKTLQQITARVNPYHQSVTRNAKIAAKARRKFDRSDVMQILADPRPQRVIAKEFGVAQATISDIKVGKTYRFLNNPFAGLGAR